MNTARPEIDNSQSMVLIQIGFNFEVMSLSANGDRRASIQQG